MSKNKKEKKEIPDALRYFLFTVVVIAVISVIGVLAYHVIGTQITGEKEKEKVNINEVEIKGYGIHLDDNDTTLYRNEYKALEKNLLGEEIDYNEYAKSIAKMFIIDLYTIKNKSNKYDVGGVDFVYSKALKNYTTNVTDTIYKYVEDNSNGDRVQQLPAVKAIMVDDISKGKFKVEAEEKEYEAYTVKLTWEYSINLGYDTTGEVIIINKDNKLYVVEKN